MKLHNSVLGASAILMSLAAAPAFAQGQGSGGDANIEAFEDSQPHGQGTSNGIPVIVGTRGGEPVIRYQGATPGARGLEDGRIPQFSGSRGGDPDIVYGGAPAAGAPARPATPGRGAPAAARPAPNNTNEANIVATVQRARAAITRGNFGAASTLLEQAETAILNARSDGTTGHAALLQSISDARAASGRRDRAAALQALDGARNSYMRERGAG